MKAQPIDPDQLRRAVEALDCEWHYLEQTGSTNADALRHHTEHGRDLVAFSEAQSAGRGRRGREWLSPFARNLYCTVGINRSIPAANQGLLSIVTGIALCRVLRRETGLGVALKWPNDLLLDERKLGGILIESRATANEQYFFAIGFGLNVHMTDDELEALDRPVTCIGQHLDHPVDRGALLQASIDAVVNAIRTFDVNTVPQLIDEFAGLDAYRDAEVEVVDAVKRIHGVNRGIDSSGQLRLETARGVELHSAAEISMRVPTP